MRRGAETSETSIAPKLMRIQNNKLRRQSLGTFGISIRQNHIARRLTPKELLKAAAEIFPIRLMRFMTPALFTKVASSPVTCSNAYTKS